MNGNDPRRFIAPCLFIALGIIGCGREEAAPPKPPLPATAPAPVATATETGQAVKTVAGMPPVPDPTNLYSETTADKMSPVAAQALSRVYVPNRISGDVYVVDPAAFKVVDRFRVGVTPQHVVPAWDLKTLWVANNAEGSTKGSLTPIDPLTGKPGPAVPVEDPYNLYFTPDGGSAIVVAEAHQRLDFRDPRTMALQWSLDIVDCPGINHGEFSIDGSYALFTCEYNGSLAKIDLVNRKVVGYVQVLRPGVPTQSVKGADGKDQTICTSWKGMPQDIRVSPDGRLYFVADMMADGVHVVDGGAFQQIDFIPTGVGAHGLYPSRDGKKLYVANRGSNKVSGPRRGKGSVSVIDFATRKVEATWPIPGGGSPDMGNVSADGKLLWLSGRFDNVVYAIDTTSGEVRTIPVGREPHGLTVWPQPGRYSLGHTGNMR